MDWGCWRSWSRRASRRAATWRGAEGGGDRAGHAGPIEQDDFLEAGLHPTLAKQIMEACQRSDPERAHTPEGGLPEKDAEPEERRIFQVEEPGVDAGD